MTIPKILESPDDQAPWREVCTEGDAATTEAVITGEMASGVLGPRSFECRHSGQILLYHRDAGGSLLSYEPWHPGFWAVQETRREGVPDGGFPCRSGNGKHTQKFKK